MLPILITLLLAQAPDAPDVPDVDINLLHDEMISLSGGASEAEAPAASPFEVSTADYVNSITASAPFRRARRGILVVGSGDTVRAMEPFKWTSAGLDAYASAVNEYAARMPEGVRVYCMPVPTAVAYYCPDGARSFTSSTRSAMLELFSRLSPSVTPVDIFPTLGAHAAEPIYSRTDHHWAPLGAYYAAGCFAAAAGLPFLPLESYLPHSVDSYVGTMARFSADRAVGNAPEQFVYYTPADSSAYSVRYVKYDIRRQRGATVGTVTGESEPQSGPFFYSSFRGSSAYLTFMGGDTRLTHITTTASTGRRLLILKDSFGNAIPPYLFSAFDDIHVVDCRYFTRNILTYITDNGITDLLFVNNMTHAVTPRTSTAYQRYLVQ